MGWANQAISRRAEKTRPWTSGATLDCQRAWLDPLIGALCADARLSHYATAEEMRGWLDASGYVGDAPDRARHLAALLRRSGG